MPEHQQSQKFEPLPKFVRSVAYVRMSTDQQENSTLNQEAAIRKYAAAHGFKIVRVYSDEGKSGLEVRGRSEFQKLSAEVESGKADFKAVLVYDVSRWGRFQNLDEAAYHKFTFSRVGIAIHFCAEQFVNDGSLVGSLQEHIKRYMAAEYSSNLSEKVFQGAVRLAQNGFRQGGAAGYGLRRVLLDQNGKKKTWLSKGERKSLQTERVVLEPGPKEEIKIVQWMYKKFVEDRWTESQIAISLNEQNVLIDSNRQWTRGSVHGILTNEKYIGNNVYNRTSFRLKKKHVNNPRELWVQAAGVFKGIVDTALFASAQEIILTRSKHFSPEEMLAQLKQLLNTHGKLSGFLIDECEDMPSSSAYRHRFGSLVKAYRLIEYTPKTDYTFLEINRHLRKLHPEVIEEVITGIRSTGASVRRDEETDLLLVNGELNVSVVLSRCRKTEAGSPRWLIRMDQSLQPDITIAVRMSVLNDSILDYYLLPTNDLSEQLRIASTNGAFLDVYRYDDLRFFFALTSRALIQEAA